MRVCCFILTGHNLGCAHELVQRWLVWGIPFVDRECLSRGKGFLLFVLFFNVFCKLFSLSTFCYYPVYISLIYHFLKENSNNFKFTFQFQHQMRKIRDEQLYPAWVIFVRFSCMNFNNTFTFCNLIIQKCFQ